MHIAESELERLIGGLFGNGLTEGNIIFFDKNDNELRSRDLDEIIDFAPTHISLETDRGELVGFGLTDEETPEHYPDPSAMAKNLSLWFFDTAITSDTLPHRDGIIDIPLIDYKISDNFYQIQDFDEVSEPSTKIDTSKSVTFAMASTAKSGKDQWTNQTGTVGQFIEMLLAHTEGKKDGACFLQGEIAGSGRSAKALIKNYFIGLDLDTGETAEEIDTRLAETGLAYIRYTTHSHLKDVSEAKRDGFFKWCGMDATKNVDPKQLKKYLQEVKGIIPRVLETFEILEDDKVSEEGTLTIIRHAPMPKHRIIFFLSEPFVFQGKANQTEEVKAWKEHYHGFGTSLGFVYDKSCLDPARLFYLPRHAKGQPFETKFVDGDYVDLRTYERVAMTRDTNTQSVNAFTSAAGSLGVSGDGMYVDGYNLKRWIVTHDCDIVSLIEEYYPDAVKSPRTNGPGFHIECPFEDEHTKAGGLGTFAINGSDNDKGFHIHCTHDSCHGRNKLEYIKKMVELEWFPVAALSDETYCPSIIKDEDSTIVPDEDEEELDVDALIETLNKESTKDDAIDVLRRIGRMADLDKDEYDTIIGKIGRRTKVKKRELAKFVPTKFKKSQEESTKILDEAEKILMAYNERYAMVDTGSKVVIMDFNKKDMSFMNRDDWKALKANEKILVSTGQNESKMESVAKVWSEWSQRRTYEGVTFDPRPAPDKSKMNLFNGFTRVPRKGKWDLLKNHIFTVLCHSNENEFFWLLTWMAHIFQRPWEKMGSAIVVRGTKGAGKSIAFGFLKDLLDKYAMSSANSSHITGNFNWHFRDKLLLIAEEGLFAGSAKDDSVLKELITGKTLTMEPKGIDAFDMENFVRLIIISNEEWVINATPDERRYYVTEALDTHKDNLQYFEAITEQMDNGGYEAMMYDLLNFEPPFEEGWKILRRPPKTKALAKQISRSTHAWERFFISLVENMGVSEATSDIEPIELEYDETTLVKPDDLRYYYYDSLRTSSSKYYQTPEAFREFLKKYFPGVKNVKVTVGNSKQVFLKIPPLSEVIPHIENNLKIKLDMIEFESE